MKKTTISSIIIAISMIVFTTKVQAATGKVTTETLNLRSKASTDSSVVKLLNMDDELEIISEEEGHPCPASLSGERGGNLQLSSA